MVETKITRISNECSFVWLYVCTVNTHYSYCKVAYFKPLSSSTFVLVHFKRFYFLSQFFYLLIFESCFLSFSTRAKKFCPWGKSFFFVSNKDKEWRKSSDFILKKFIKRCKVAAHKSQIGDFFCWISVCDRLKPSLYEQKLKRRIIAASRLFNIAPVSWIISAWKNFKLEIIAKNDWNYKQ